MPLAFAVAASVSLLAGAATLPVLDAAALPRLTATTHAVAARDLASDVAGGTRFERLLRTWGYSGGRERDFQGESPRIDRVVSRTLAFERASGAHAYVEYVGTHAAALYGAGSSARPVTSRGRSGYLFEAASCACHRATPTVLAVLTRGTRVTWLEANGGAVTPAVALALLARAP